MLLSAVSGSAYGPETGWAAAYPECQERNQSPINIADQDTKVSMEYQELTLDGFEAESSNKTSMKNTGKTVAILLKDDYFVRGAGLPGRFKAEKVEFHWGQSNGSDGSEHSINGRRFPVEVRSCFIFLQPGLFTLNLITARKHGAPRRNHCNTSASAEYFSNRGKPNKTYSTVPSPAKLF
ncbi:hypothetical protein MHYP_G00267500 [Metynnis hypsauchen]